MGEKLLISKSLLDELPASIVENFTSVGSVKPRGKQQLIELFGYREEVAEEVGLDAH
ncbi:MAG TPA: hypothetical protein VK589_20135 [Chryseolinea sp.]|nr:hypothetical protein [Chryseolinea sp.]